MNWSSPSLISSSVWYFSYFYDSLYSKGLADANKTCSPRYYCRRNATTGTPNQGEDANICPQGHYCPAGTGEPEKCPAGTFTNQTGKPNAKTFYFKLVGIGC